MAMTGAEKKLVRAYFGKTQIDVEGLNAILEKTGNSRYALDLLFGTASSPEDIPQKAKNWGGEEATFVLFDPWTEQVTFSYKTPDLVSIYVPVGIEAKEVTAENWEQYKDNKPGPTVRQLHFRYGPIVVETDKTSLNTWNDRAELFRKTRQ